MLPSQPLTSPRSLGPRYLLKVLLSFSAQPHPCVSGGGSPCSVGSCLRHPPARNVVVTWVQSGHLGQLHAPHSGRGSPKATAGAELPSPRES